MSGDFREQRGIDVLCLWSYFLIFDVNFDFDFVTLFLHRSVVFICVMSDSGQERQLVL